MYVCVCVCIAAAEYKSERETRNCAREYIAMRIDGVCSFLYTERVREREDFSFFRAYKRHDFPRSDLLQEAI